MKSGIYKILNKVNGKFYIGSAIEIKKRWREHKHHLNKNAHKNPHLQAAWNKYWDISFEFIILEYVEKENLVNREQHWIDETNCHDRDIGYNLNKIANSMLGFRHSEETKNKFRNKIYTDEIKANMSKGQIGKKYSKETKLKLSKLRKGVKHSKEHIEARMKHHRGKVLSEETKALISTANKGRKISPEAIAKREASKRRNKGLDLI